MDAMETDTKAVLTKEEKAAIEKAQTEKDRVPGQVAAARQLAAMLDNKEHRVVLCAIKAAGFLTAGTTHKQVGGLGWSDFRVCL
jgi:hypothetical protein